MLYSWRQPSKDAPLTQKLRGQSWLPRGRDSREGRGWRTSNKQTQQHTLKPANLGDAAKCSARTKVNRSVGERPRGLPRLSEEVAPVVMPAAARQPLPSWLAWCHISALILSAALTPMCFSSHVTVTHWPSHMQPRGQTRSPALRAQPPVATLPCVRTKTPSGQPRSTLPCRLRSSRAVCSLHKVCDVSWGSGRWRRTTPARAGPKPSSRSRVFLWLLAKLIYISDVQKVSQWYTSISLILSPYRLLQDTEYRSLLLIYFIYSSSCLLIPYS